MKPFKDQGWQYYERCKSIMYASKARGSCAFFAGVGSADTPASTSSSSNDITPAPVESTISTPATDPLSINSFGDIHNMTNTLSNLYHAAQGQVKPTLLPPFGHASDVMGDDGEVISVSSSSYGIKRSHGSMTSMTTSTSTDIPQSHSSQHQAPPSTQSTSSDPSIALLPMSLGPPKKCSKGKSKDVTGIVPPSRAKKEKITTAVAVNGMQGTINCMTDMLANVLDPNKLVKAFVNASASASLTSDTSMGPPAQLPAAAGSSTASSNKRAVLQHLKHDDSLTSDEKARLLNIFTKNADALETYMELLDDDALRLGYAHELLKDI